MRKTSHPKKRPHPKSPSPASGLTPAELLRFFLQLFPRRALLHLPALKGLRFYERLFTPLVTLWYLLFQWLNHDHTLQAVLADAKAGGANRLNPKLAGQRVSSSTASYSNAQSRLPLNFLAQALRLQGSQITRQSPATLCKGLLVSLLDGTTIRLRPYGNIPRKFPPHRNQHQKAYWCLMRVVVTFCCLSGAALDCTLGPVRLSEQALACKILLRATVRCLFIGDRNFGVFRIVQVARQACQHVLLRLTDARAAKLLGCPLQNGDFAVSWTPTRHDRLQPRCSKDPVQGRLIVQYLDRPGFRPQWLCLFTTLTDQIQYPLKQLVTLYGMRWHVELDLRYIKDQMKAAQLEVHSTAMVRKQWLACLMAYNLVRAAMLCAALHKGLCPLSLSFSACRRRLEVWLRHFGRFRSKILACWQRTLAEMGTCRLPKRKEPRPSEPRAKRYVRESFPPLVGSRAQAREKLQNHPMES